MQTSSTIEECYSQSTGSPIDKPTKTRASSDRMLDRELISIALIHITSTPRMENPQPARPKPKRHTCPNTKESEFSGLASQLRHAGRQCYLSRQFRKLCDSLRNTTWFYEGVSLSSRRIRDETTPFHTVDQLAIDQVNCKDEKLTSSFSHAIMVP
jgi:hypothetical protein